MNDNNGNEGSDEDRTVFRPASAPPPPAAPVSTPPSSASPTMMPGTFIPMAPRTGEAHIQVGDVLNHIFRVDRFIARGGMGEVFEGYNVNEQERVAIKVMLPALAADPSVMAMFHKEARTLKRLLHPALVQYVILAQEPQLGVYYIVTEFIDGVNLSDVLGKIQATPAELLALTKRLAEGLRAAHALGAIHRDMSPDNVLLQDGKLAQARIIDFGIAKDLDPGAKTVIGDGFAGKLGYVAPEQLGDFDKQVGPWSDVYGLGLVILAVALGRNVDMGSSFVEAIDRRRKGVDLTAAPKELAHILSKMLVANPAERFRSMDEVIDAVDAALGSGADVAAKARADARQRDHAPVVPPPPAEGGGKGKLIAGGAVGALLLLGGGAYLAFGGKSGPPETATVAPVVPAGTAAAAGPAAAARAAVEKALPGLDCTWLDITNVTQTADGVAVALAGAAGHPADAQAAVSKTVTDAGLQLASADFSDVAPISGSECDSINALRAIRAPGPAHLSVPQRKFEMSKLPPDSNYAGKIGARTVFNIDVAPPVQDFALYGIEPIGQVSAVVASRADFNTIPKTGYPIADLGNGKYRFQVDADHTGWSGIIMLTGSGNFADKYVVTPPGGHTDWRAFAAAAATNGWKSEMVWFKMVDELPN